MGTPSAAPPDLTGRVTRIYEAAVTRIQEALGEPAFTNESDQETRMTREQAIEFVLADRQLP